MDKSNLSLKIKMLNQPKIHPLLRLFRNSFITGIVLLIPLAATYIVVNFLIERVGDPASRIFFWFLDVSIRSNTWVSIGLSIVSLLVVVVLITLLGILSHYLIGRIIINICEKVVDRLPFVNTVYRTVKQIVNTFSEQQKTVFQQVVLIEYPRKGSWVLGFHTSDTKGEIQHKTGRHLVNVFVPTTPNPTSGFLLMIPKEDVTLLDMTIGEGMKVIISGGAVTPLYQKEEETLSLDKMIPPASE